MGLGIAIKKDNNVYFGVDSYIVTTIVNQPLTGENTKKIAKMHILKDTYVIDPSDMKMLTAVKIIDRNYEIDQRPLDYEFLLLEFVPRLIQIMREYNYMDTNDDLVLFPNPILIFDNKNIFLIKKDKTIVQLEDMAVVGSSVEFGFGSLLSNDSEDSYNQILTALRAAENFTINTKKPFFIGNVNDGSINRIDE